MSSPNNTKIVKTSINEDGILRIILDNPKNHNTLSEDMMSSIQNALDEAKIDDKVRVIIISAIDNLICLLYTSPSPRDRG